jgi:putative ABC transport system permease protein
MRSRPSRPAPPEADSRIPAPARLALRILLPEEEREFFLGDLNEGRPPSWLREVLGAASLHMAKGPDRRHRSPRKGDGIMQELAQDLRYGLRTMIRSPGFTVVALLTMAMGIGANTAMFSIVNGVVFRPLPYPEPDRIVRVWESLPSQGWSTFSFAPLNLWDWQAQNRTLELLGAYQTTVVNYTGGDRPETLPGLRVSEDYLKILGGEPAQGRGISPDDVEMDSQGVVILSHGFWQRVFGGRLEVLGTTMVLDDLPHTVVGILPEGWEVPGGSRRDVVLPLKPSASWYENRGSHFLHAYGRLKPGVSVEQAQSDLSSIAAALEAEYPDTNEGWGATVRTLEDVVLGSTRPQLLIFMASVGLILLIACANLANMTLARSLARSREMAIRTAVGAGRGRVVRQLLAESLLLAAVGGTLGVVLAYTALEAFITGWPDLLPRMQEIEVNGAVLLFSLGLSLVAGLLFGLAPALTVAAPDVSGSLRQGSRSIAGDRSRRWMRATLVTAEVGLAVVLLVGSGLLVRSFAALQGQSPGFVPQDRLIVSVPLSRVRYGTPEERRAFVDATLPRMQALPGVESAALSTLIPMGGDDELWGFWLEGRPSTESEDGAALFYRVTPGYFETMGISILAGRDISADDREGSLPVVVVSASFVEQHLSGENPVGKRFRFGREEDNPHVEIVGVVGDVQHYQLGRTSVPQIYVPYQQRPSGYFSLVFRCAVPPLGLVNQVRDAVASVDPDQPLEEARPADALIDSAVATPRFRTLLMGGFGLTALLLAVVGLYGIMAYSVSQRTKEIGVRMALGASRGSVLGLVFREGVPLVGMGLGIGLVGAVASSRILESMLFGVGARDVAVFVSVPLILATVAVAAMLVPARRAAGVDPVRTLGEE